MQSNDINESFSRSGGTHPLGAFDAELGRTPMHGQTIDILRGMAAKQGLPLAEFVRFHLDIVAYGVDGVQRMHAERIARMAVNLGV